jgi:hypothetical protein
MIIRAFITHKKAEKYADCQDRFGVNIGTKSISVSDGMSQSWQQKIWAQLLVDTYTDSCEWLPSHDNIRQLCNLWRDKVIAYIKQLKQQSRENLTQKEINILDALIYRNERNLAEGRSAGATFVGVRFNKLNWSGLVLGDSCLIEWDGQKAIFHTSQLVDSFDNRPDYFDSNPLSEGKGIPKNIRGSLSEKSVLLLVSDPFSDFLLEHNKQGDISNYIHSLLNIASHDDFETIVEDWRNNGMHNDDATLVVVQDDNSEDLKIQTKDDINNFIDIERAETQKEEEKLEKTSIRESNSNDVIEEKPISVIKDTTTFSVSECTFIEEFLNEYRSILEKKRLLGKLKFNTTRKAAKEALFRLFERYSIIKK